MTSLPFLPPNFLCKIAHLIYTLTKRGENLREYCFLEVNHVSPHFGDNLMIRRCFSGGSGCSVFCFLVELLSNIAEAFYEFCLKVMDKFHWILLVVNKYEKRRTELRIYKAGSGLLSGDRNIKLDFRSKVLFWNLFELFYGLDKVISFVVHVSTSMTVYFRQMHLFNR